MARSHLDGVWVANWSSGGSRIRRWYGCRRRLFARLQSKADNAILSFFQARLKCSRKRGQALCFLPAAPRGPHASALADKRAPWLPLATFCERCDQEVAHE